MQIRNWFVRQVTSGSIRTLSAYQAIFAWGILATAAVSAAPTVQFYGLQSHDPSRAFQGYTIYADGFTRRIYLVDMNGTEVHSWSHPDPTLPISFNPEPLPNGNLLLRLRREETNIATDNRMVELDWDSNISWEFYNPAHTNMHHDRDRLRNGNTLITEPY